MADLIGGCSSNIPTSANVFLKDRTPNSVGPPVTEAPNSEGQGVRKKRASRAGEGRFDVAKNMRNCRRKVKRFVNQDNATLFTCLEFGKDEEQKLIKVFNVVDGEGVPVDMSVANGSEAGSAYSLQQFKACGASPGASGESGGASAEGEGSTGASHIVFAFS